MQVATLTPDRKQGHSLPRSHSWDSTFPFSTQKQAVLNMHMNSGELRIYILAAERLKKIFLKYT